MPKPGLPPRAKFDRQCPDRTGGAAVQVARDQALYVDQAVMPKDDRRVARVGLGLCPRSGTPRRSGRREDRAPPCWRSCRRARNRAPHGSGARAVARAPIWVVICDFSRDGLRWPDPAREQVRLAIVQRALGRRLLPDAGGSTRPAAANAVAIGPARFRRWMRWRVEVVRAAVLLGPLGQIHPVGQRLR